MLQPFDKLRANGVGDFVYTLSARTGVCCCGLVVANRGGDGSGQWGVLWSEVKEEGAAEGRPGGVSPDTNSPSGLFVPGERLGLCPQA